MPKNYRVIDENCPEPEAKRTKTNVFHHCYDCEEQFNPTRKGQKFCAKCFKGRPSVNSTAVDHCDLQKKTMAVAPTYSKLVPEYQPSISSVGSIQHMVYLCGFIHSIYHGVYSVGSGCSQQQ